MVVDNVRYYADGGKNCNYFTAKVHCKNSLCTVFKFIVKTSISISYISTFATVFRCNEICYAVDDNHRRPLKGNKYKKIGEKIEYIFPSKLRLEMMKQTDEKELNVGNLNSVPDLQVLQQIKSQYTKKDYLHQDFDVFLDMLTEQLDK